ncbi:hypothetical protein [Flavobacterium sp. C3NV]|uniref:hypothetical protein n=1 Tax=Flavobacterium sp. C3NV TaxID=3393358 RepID=UPI00398FB23E
MKKKILLLVLLSFSFSIYSKNLSLKKETTLNSTLEINNKLDDLEKLISHKSDSLNKEILYYRVKEDFYSTALADQGNRFTIIVSGIIALFSIISFGAFKYEIRKLHKQTDKKLNKHKNEISEFKKDLEETKTELKSSKANLSTSIALHFEKKKDFVSAFYYYISAAKSHGESSQEKKELNIEHDLDKKHYQTCKNNLNLASENLKKISSNAEKEILKEKIKSIKKFMNDIQNLDDDEVKNQCSLIRIELLTVINSIVPAAS